MEDNKNYIKIDCSKINAKATLEIASEVLKVLKDSYKGEYDKYVSLSVKADNV